jgi:hypothetical protein
MLGRQCHDVKSRCSNCIFRMLVCTLNKMDTNMFKSRKSLLLQHFGAAHSRNDIRKERREVLLRWANYVTGTERT